MGLGRSNYVEYTLISKSQGKVNIPEPINFDEGNGNIYERDKDSKGFLKTKSNSLEYHGAAYDFLTRQFVTRGVAEDVIQQKRVKSDDRLDERWKTVSRIYLDLGSATFDDKRRTVKTKTVQGGLYKMLDSSLDDEIDIVPNFSLEGKSIPSLRTENISLTGREIFLRSVLSVEDGVQISAVVSGTEGLIARSIPFKVDINSDQDNITAPIGDQLSAANGNYANLSADKSGNCFFTASETDKVIVLNGNVKVTLIDGDFGIMSMDLVIYEGGSDLLYNESRRVNLVPPKSPTLGTTMEYSFDDFEIVVKKGDSIAIGLLSDTDDGIRYQVSDTYLTITEDSFYKATNCRSITEFNLIERLLAKLTGQENLLKSDYLEKSNRLLTQGFWIRGFPDVIAEGSDEERKIQFTVSLKSIFEHLEAMEPIAWWTEWEGNREVLRIEPLKYTQQNFVGIRYGEIADKFRYIKASNVKRTNLSDNFYSKVEIGSSIGGDGYEEVFGLQSVCGKASFKTINPTTSVYQRLSPFRLGDVDVEIPRRKQFEDFPETDTQYDSDIMVLSCKKVNGRYYLKSWSDDYVERPTNIYRPDSAFNLDLTPARLLLKHSFTINIGLYHYPVESLRFLSSNCNSSFTSKKANEEALREDANIPHSRLEKPGIRPKSVDFNLPVDLRLESQITGYNGSVPNWFGLVAVQTDFGIEYMRLVKVDTNKEGTHKLVEAFV